MNIYDIAKLAGVSIATVSRVVNDSPKVSERTKQRVRAVMEENRYTPNVFARGLGLDSMKTVGIVCPDVSDTYMAGAVSSLEKRIHENGYDCILSCSGYETDHITQAVQLILLKRIDALVLVGSVYVGSDNDSLEAAAVKEAAEQVPVFLINGYVRHRNVYCVTSDDYQATYEAATKLIESGRRRILFLSDSHSYSANKKLEGYEAALRDKGFPVLGDLKLYTKNQVHYTRDILLEHKNLEFDSVLATDDGLAVGAVKYALAKCLKIPEDISIIGFNNLELASCCEPELTSINCMRDKLCSIAVDHMMEILKGIGRPQHKKQLKCQLVKRSTTDF